MFIGNKKGISEPRCTLKEFKLPFFSFECLFVCLFEPGRENGRKIRKLNINARGFFPLNCKRRYL